jgi:hypothetical protein
LSRPLSRQLLVAVALLAVLCTQLAWVSRFNFFGYDEWTIQYLLSRGVIDVPYANRSLGFIWLLPIPLLWPNDFAAWSLLYLAYAWGAALLLFGLVRRLAPGRPLLAFAAACLLLAWSPSDLARLACLERAEYMSFTFAVLLALRLFLAAWQRRSAALLAVAVLVAFVAVRSYEATLPLLLAGPFAIAWAAGERSREFWRWTTAWLAFLVLAGCLVAMPMLVPMGRSYQQALGFDPHPLHALARVAHHYRLHLAPLAQAPLAELAARAVAAAVAAFLAGAWLCARLWAGESRPRRRRDLGAMAIGLAFAGLGYVLFALNTDVTAWRKEFLAGPGIALFLAALFSWAASWAPEAWRRPLFVALVGLVVARGTGRTLALQATWERASYYEVQIRFLEGLTRAVPDVRPHTLLVLLDEGGAWRSDFGFRHATRYLYSDRASGWAYDRPTYMFPTGLTALGVLCVPWPEVQRAWRDPAALHRYDELVVVRHGPDGGVEVAGRWPSELPPLPPGARYDPGARILPVAVEHPARATLRAGSGAARSSARPSGSRAGASAGR